MAEIDHNDVWVVFGINKSARVLSEILGDRLAFFIAYNEDKSIEYQPEKIYTLDDVKESLGDKKILLGYYDPKIENEMRKLLQNVSVKAIHQFGDITHLDHYGEYDYSVILDTIWEQGLYSEFAYHLDRWKMYGSSVFLNPINELLQKYHMLNKKTLLDVACGYGLWSRYFSIKGFQVSAIDNVKKNLEVLRAVNNKEKLNIYVQELDIRNMESISDASYGVSCCFCTVHVVPNWRQAIREMIRITGEGGYIVLIIGNFDNEYFKRQYKDVIYTQWDATKDNIVDAMKPEAALVDEIGISDREGATQDSPSLYILVFQKFDE